MSKTQDDLPQELLIEIFTRLPAKSVGKCRCLSKSWNYYLSTPQFIKLHLTRKPHQQNLIFITQSHSLHTITSPIQNNAVSKKLELGNTWNDVVGSCNGLVLLVSKKWELCLINPLTSHKVNIPNFYLASNKPLYGFGYDSCSDDYKIVALSLYNGVGSSRDTFVDVYSVKRGVWKRVTNIRNVFYGYSHGVLVNGAIHWLTKNTTKPSIISAFGGLVSEFNPPIISAFDLVNEVFYEIPIPAAIKKEHLTLNVLGDRLCLTGHSDVWTMEEYGFVESWTILFNFGENYLEVVKPLGFIEDNETVLLTTFGEEWIVYNVKERTSTLFVVDGVSAHFNVARIFFDSLVSLGYLTQEMMLSS